MARHSDRRGEQRSKPRPGPQMPNLEAMLGMGMDIRGQMRGSVDDGAGRDILGPNDKPDINSFLGRTMRGGKRGK